MEKLEVFAWRSVAFGAKRAGQTALKRALIIPARYDFGCKRCEGRCTDASEMLEMFIWWRTERIVAEKETAL